MKAIEWRFKRILQCPAIGNGIQRFFFCCKSVQKRSPLSLAWAEFLQSGEKERCSHTILNSYLNFLFTKCYFCLFRVQFEKSYARNQQSKRVVSSEWSYSPNIFLQLLQENYNFPSYSKTSCVIRVYHNIFCFSLSLIRNLKPSYSIPILSA